MAPDRKALARRAELCRRWRTRRDIEDLRSCTARDETAGACYRPFVRTGGVCCDVGAGIGNRLEVFHRLGARGAAVEPGPRCARVLRAAYGDDPRVVVVDPHGAPAPAERSDTSESLTPSPG